MGSLDSSLSDVKKNDNLLMYFIESGSHDIALVGPELTL